MDRIWERAPLSELQASLQEISTFNEMAWFSYWKAVFEAQLSLLDFFRGNWADALLHARTSCGCEAELSVWGVGIGTLFRHMAYAGDRDGALAMLGEKRAWLPAGSQPSIRGSWLMLALVIVRRFRRGNAE